MANRLIEVGQKNWEQTRYHQPQDDMDQPGLNFDAAVKYAQFVFLCGFLTEDSQRPIWNKGDFLASTTVIRRTRKVIDGKFHKTS